MPVIFNSSGDLPIDKRLVAHTLAFLGGVLLAESFSYFPYLTALFVILGTFLFKKSGFLRCSLVLCSTLGFFYPSLTTLSIRLDDLGAPVALSNYVDADLISLTAKVAAAPQHAPCRVRLQMEARKLFTPQGTQPLHGLFRLTLLTPETSFAYGDEVKMQIALRSFQQFENPGVFPTADYLERQGIVGQVTLQNEDALQLIRPGENHFLRALYRYRDAIRRCTEPSEQTAPVGRCGNNNAYDAGGLSGRVRSDNGDDVTDSTATSGSRLSGGTGATTAPNGRCLSGVAGATPLAILLAMTIGESGFLTDPIQDIFTASGTNHILSISGSHLAMIAFLLFGSTRFVLRRLPAPLLLRLSLYKMPSQWAALITIPAVTFYALVSGMAIATERSLIMIGVYLLALWIGRANDVLIALSLAAWVIVLRQPAAIFDISFQLSFLAVLFMILVMDAWRHRYPPAEAGTESPVEKIRRPLVLMLLTSLGATLGTVPLTLYYFHQFSWASFLANPLLIPFVGFVVLPLGLASMLIAPFLGFFPAAGLHHAIGSFYFEMTRFFARLPGADLHFASPSLPLVLLFYILLPILFLRRVSFRWMGGVVALFFVIFLGWGSLRIHNPLKVTFLDVGQGDAALIEFPNGETMLVDAGAGEPFDRGRNAIAPFLWERKIRTLDYLVGTHPQDDHMGGFTFLIKTFHVKQILTNGISVTHRFYQSLSDAAKEQGISPRGVTRRNAPLFISGCRVRFLNPQDDPNDVTDLNNDSIVFRLSCPASDPASSGISFLFTGDIEEEGIQAILKSKAFLKSDILKVPHHGGRGSLNRDFLEQVAPKAALFSAGRNNRYGHPHPRVIAEYARRGIPIYRTDYDGAVTVTQNVFRFDIRSFVASKRTKIRSPFHR